MNLRLDGRKHFLFHGAVYSWRVIYLFPIASHAEIELDSRSRCSIASFYTIAYCESQPYKHFLCYSTVWYTLYSIVISLSSYAHHFGSKE